MENALTALESALRDEVAAYTVLVNRLPFKTTLIRKNRVQLLEQIVAKEDGELRTLAQLDVLRSQALSEVIKHLPTGIAPNLSSLLPHLSRDWRDRLKPLGDKLRELVEQLRQGHETCNILLQASLEYVDVTMTLISRAMINAQPALYGEAAPDEPAAPSILLDRRA